MLLFWKYIIELFREGVSVKRKTKIFIVIIIITITCIFSSILSADKFGTLNPVAGGIGFIRIMTSDAPFIIIQNKPKVIFLAKPQVDIVKALENHGYEYIEEERMGSMLTFKIGENKQLVYYSVNGYFARWIFQ